MNPSLDDWNVECEPVGQCGYFFYHEGSRELPFVWEYGGDGVIVIVRFEQPDKLPLRYLWAVERRREILERVAQEVIRQRAPTCVADIDEQSLCIYVKEKDAA